MLEVNKVTPKVSNYSDILLRYTNYSPVTALTKCVKLSSIITLLDGYGILKLEGSNIPKRAHRVVWEFCNGAVPKGMYVCHTCDIRHCVNINHLFLGTHTDNMRDMINKGRGKQPDNRGSRHGLSKLTEKQVKSIKKLLKLNISCRDIASKYGVNRNTIGDIKAGRGWKHV